MDGTNTSENSRNERGDKPTIHDKIEVSVILKSEVMSVLAKMNRNSQMGL